MKKALMMTGLILAACSGGGEVVTIQEVSSTQIGLKMAIQAMGVDLRCILEVTVDPDQEIETILTAWLEGTGNPAPATLPLQVRLFGEDRHYVFYEMGGIINAATFHAKAITADGIEYSARKNWVRHTR